MRSYTTRRPFCLKDPRFSYTLSAWRQQAPDARFICVFREPNKTAQSMIAEARKAEYLRHFKFDYSAALRVWEAMYARILNQHAREGDWLFLHYDQAMSGDAFDRLESFTGARVDRSFPEKALSRSPAVGEASPAVQAIYERLCELAGFIEPVA
jgi:hypothetical protein